MSREQEIWDAVEMERVDIMDSDATISFGDAWEQAAGRVMQRMADRLAALEARAEAGVTEAMQKAREALLVSVDLLRDAITSDDGLDAADAVVGVNAVLSAVRLLESAGAADPHVAPSAETGSTDPCTCAGDNGDGSAGFCGHCGGMRKPVAWWIGPHDGLLAGATVNKSLADARIEHGATVRPLVFGDVAPSAEARVDADAVINAAREVVRFGNAYMWDTTFEILTTQSWSVLSRELLDYDMKRAALTGGASDGE